MKTSREEQIAAIRMKCVEANPEKNWGRLRYDQGEITGGEEEPIRLADVLLVIESATKFPALFDYWTRQDGQFLLKDSDSNIATWNLRKDDLTQQSDECIKFLADLLA